MELKSKDEWSIDEHKKYLWIHDISAIQVMIFNNDQEEDIKCIWVKMLHKGEFVSNYFVYSIDNEKIHPLDYALKMIKQFKESEEECKNTTN